LRPTEGSVKKPTRLTTEQARTIDESIVRGGKVRSLLAACRALGLTDGCSIARDRIINNAIYKNHAEHETYGRLLRNRVASSGARGLGWYLAKFGIELRCENGYVQFFGRFRRPKEVKRVSKSAR
jgi:hypothetical protein